MPGIDFRRARQEVRLSDVLSLLGFEPIVRQGEQWGGGCPVHRSKTGGSRSFAAHLGKSVWHCVVCQTVLARGSVGCISAAGSRGALATSGTTPAVARTGEASHAGILTEPCRPCWGAVRLTEATWDERD